MKGLKTILCLGMACALSSAAFAFAGCKTEKDEELSYTQAVYQKYLAYAEAIGEEPKSYEDWLATIKGEDGAPGEPGAPGTPGAPGAPGKDGTMWYTGTLSDRDSNEDVKTGDIWLDTETFDIYTKTEEDWLKLGNLKGQDGKDASQIFTGDSLDGSKGKDGDYFLLSSGMLYRKEGGTYKECFSLKGSKGDSGNTWHSSNGVPDNSLGNDGDFCLDTKNLTIYEKKSRQWEQVCKLQTAAPTDTITVENDTQVDVIGDNNEEGWYKVLLKTGSTALTGDQLKAIRVTVVNTNSVGNAKSSSFEKSAESTPDNNIYFAVIPEFFYDIGSGSYAIQNPTMPRKVKFSGITGAIECEVETKKWEPSTVNAFDTEFDFFYVSPLNTLMGYSKIRDIYQDYYGGSSAMPWESGYTCQQCIGSAFFFDSSLYSQISGKTLLLQYGDNTVNKFPEFDSTGASDYYWLGDKAGTKNTYTSGKTGWDYLATEGFTYLTIDNLEGNSDKYFFELNGVSGKNYKDGVGKLNHIVPMKLKVTLKSE